MNREELILNMDRCTNGIAQVDCEDCPYNKENFCRLFLMRDALNYIKEEAEVETAKKIFADIDTFVDAASYRSYWDEGYIRRSIKEVKAKHGVED